MKRSKWFALVLGTTSLLSAGWFLGSGVESLGDHLVRDTAVASRYPLRSRTPNFYARSKASNVKVNNAKMPTKAAR